MKIEDLQIYSVSLELANEVWKIVLKWDFFARSTIGKQLVRAADSVPANISEGFGRYHYKKNNFSTMPGEALKKAELLFRWHFQEI